MIRWLRRVRPPAAPAEVSSSATEEESEEGGKEEGGDESGKQVRRARAQHWIPVAANALTLVVQLVVLAGFIFRSCS
jgi:hypothetical protein